MPWGGVPASSGSNAGSISVRGSVATAADLPSGSVRGDSFISRDDGHLHIYDASGFVDAGPIIGPSGATPTFVAGNVTALAAGSAPTASVVKVAANTYRLDLALPSDIGSGGGGSSSGPRPSFTYTQVSEAKTWTFTHTLSFAPSDVRIVDASDPDVDWSVDHDYDAASKTFTLHFPIPVAGTVTVS